MCHPLRLKGQLSAVFMDMKKCHLQGKEIVKFVLKHQGTVLEVKKVFCPCVVGFSAQEVECVCGWVEEDLVAKVLCSN